MRNWLHSRFTKRLAMVLTMCFFWTALGEGLALAARDCCKDLYDQAKPQCVELSDHEMDKMMGAANGQDSCGNPGRGGCGSSPPSGPPSVGGGGGGRGGGGGGGGGCNWWCKAKDVGRSIGKKLGFMSAGCQSCGTMQVNSAYGNATSDVPAGGLACKGYPMLVKICHDSLGQYYGQVGYGRTHTFNVQAWEHPQEWPDSDVRIMAPNGTRVDFKRNVDGTFTGGPGVLSTLVSKSYGVSYTYECPASA